MNEISIVNQLAILEQALKPNGFDKLSSLDKSVLFWNFQTLMHELDIEFTDEKTNLSNDHEERIIQYAGIFSRNLPQTIEGLTEYLSSEQDERDTALDYFNTIKDAFYGDTETDEETDSEED